MVRRSFLQTMGALGAAAAPVQDSEQRTRFYTLETFSLKNGDQAGRLNDFLSNALLPAARKVHSGPKLFLEAIVASHMPQFAMIQGFNSAADALSLYTKLHEEEGYTDAVAKWESGANAPYEFASSTLLQAAGYSPEIRPLEARPGLRIFELRTYHSPTWRQLDALNERFSGPEIRIFQRSGIHPLFYTSTVFGTNLPNLTYLIPFDDLAAREKAWGAFAADPEWIKVRRESIEKHGEISSVIQISLFKATPYSPIR